MTEEKVVGRINSTAVPSPHMIGVPSDKPMAAIWDDRAKLLAEIDRLHEALTILSNIALANIELSKEKLEGE